MVPLLAVQARTPFGKPQMVIFTVDRQPFHYLPEGASPRSSAPG
jgi:hypothetical protein